MGKSGMIENYTHHIPPPCNEEIDFVHVDEHIIVVSKPAGLLSVPGRFVKDCVLNRLLASYSDVAVVHRLDLDTSGLLVFARTKLAVSELNRQFRERTITKRYIADVFGSLSSSQGSIDYAIAPDPVNRPKQLIDEINGKSALTHFTLLARFANKSRLHLFPITGRSHQLRIHLASIHHPILGCDLYAHEEALKAADRLMLHAEQLGLTHPQTGESHIFSSASPF
jgi:tRNA pseudouridine32 synthase/23S rRNA pseudouridine746 synthase